MSSTSSTGSSTGFQLTGLVSGFDWGSFINQIIQADSYPITALQTKQNTNSTQISALNTLNTNLTSLQTSLNTLNDPTLFNQRTVASTTANTTWGLTAANGTTTGSYLINVSQLATATTLKGTSNIGAGLSSTDISSTALSALRIATPITAGAFTINGVQINIASSDPTSTNPALNNPMSAVINAINSSAAGVTASYDTTNDKFVLTSNSSSPIVLGAANDTSNFLQAMRLANNGTTNITSSGTLGDVAQYSTLNNAGLNTAVSGAGAFTINGVSIAYDPTVDTLSSVLSKINSSTAGVTAAYDSVNDQVTLTNNKTGNLGVSVADTTGNLMASLGLSTGTTSLGLDAQFTVNNGGTLTSSSNTLDTSATGITGLTVSVNSTGSQNITVSADTTKASSAINDFISKYNALQDYITQETQITSSNGQVTTSVLTNNREVQDWATTLRNTAFNSISGLSGTVKMLNNLGIDFNSTNNDLSITDQTAFNNALSNNASDVSSFFTDTTNGFSKQFTSFFNSVLGQNGGTGLLNSQITTLTSQNTDMDTQIATIQRQLDQERSTLTKEFTAMEDAQSQANAAQAQIAKL
ncbi:flagellar capping protein [mine drainage metagenome]|uniref:Filament cap protein n=1 Tax=mine drainage metagenome TaxID=410659 RepID=A0A1J5SAT6_9ZZZZ